MLTKQELDLMEQYEEQEHASTITPTRQRRELSQQSNKETLLSVRHKLYGVRVQAIKMALEQYGPQSRAELEQSAGIPKELIAAVLSRMNKSLPRAGKQIHICSYVYDAEGSRRYPRAVYALGDGVDVKKPKPSPLENRRRYESKKNGMYRMNSVFNMGKSRDQIRAERKA